MSVGALSSLLASLAGQAGAVRLASLTAPLAGFWVPSFWTGVFVVGALPLAAVLRTLNALFYESPSAPRAPPDAPPADGELPQHDFIVVGGGTAGAVVATRLAEDGRFRVLLLEDGAVDTGPFFKLPIAALGFMGTPHHWGYETEGEAELVMKGRHWCPADGERGRPLIQCRGRVLGGCSSLNLCNYVRGHPADYDAWAYEHGARGWAWHQLRPYFRAAERLLGASPPENYVRDEARVRGADAFGLPADGPPAVTVDRIRYVHPLTARFLAACRRVFGVVAGPSHVLQPGSGDAAGLHWVTIEGGTRCSNARILRSSAAAAAIREGRLRVLTECRAVRVMLDAKGGDAPRATGVAVSIRKGPPILLRASREVIVCAGAINTPHLLLLSGIGASADLRKAGVDPRVELPGVGVGLRDVAAVGVATRTRHTTLDKQLRSVWPYLRYLLTRGGPLSTNTLEGSAFVSAQRLRAELGPRAARAGAGWLGGEAPAMQLLVQPMLFPFASWGKFGQFVTMLRKGALPSALTVHVALLRPASTGTVSLRASHPLAPPLIRLNYLKERADLDALVAGVRLARRVLGEASTDLLLGAELLPGDGCVSDGDLEEYVRANACHFNGSLCGSCRMGGADDERAVVDPELRVRGVRGLRVADASVFPTLVSGQLAATVTAVAHRAAALILNDHRHAAPAGRDAAAAALDGRVVVGSAAGRVSPAPPRQGARGAARPKMD